MKEFVKKNKILVGAMVFIFVGIIAIAYAAFTQGLNINGSGVNRKSNFDIHFANLSSPTIVGTASVVTAPTIQNNSTVIEDYSITLATPKDSVSYTFDIVNDGDYDATLKGLTVGPVKCSVNGNESDQSAVNVCQNIEYTLKYADGSTLQTNNDRLLSKETKQLKLTLTYKEFNDANQLPTSNVSISNLGIELVYESDQTAKTNNDGTTPYVESAFNGTGTVYTFLAKDVEDEPMYYYSGFSILFNSISELGAAAAEGSYVLDPVELNSPMYLKHNVENYIVTDHYVCFVTDKEFCLEASSSAYQSNADIIEENKTLFESQGCTVEENYVDCSDNNIITRISFDHDGYVIVSLSNSASCSSGDYGDDLRCDIY